MMTTIPDYIQTQDENVRPLLQEVYACIRAAIPEAEERISWSMPTFWKGRNLIHFAAASRPLSRAGCHRGVRRSVERVQDQ